MVALEEEYPSWWLASQTRQALRQMTGCKSLDIISICSLAHFCANPEFKTQQVLPVQLARLPPSQRVLPTRLSSS
jgi:hypothetical protein